MRGIIHSLPILALFIYGLDGSSTQAEPYQWKDIQLLTDTLESDVLQRILQPLQDYGGGDCFVWVKRDDFDSTHWTHITVEKICVGGGDPIYRWRKSDESESRFWGESSYMGTVLVASGKTPDDQADDGYRRIATRSVQSQQQPQPQSSPPQARYQWSDDIDILSDTLKPDVLERILEPLRSCASDCYVWVENKTDLEEMPWKHFTVEKRRVDGEWQYRMRESSGDMGDFSVWSRAMGEMKPSSLAEEVEIWGHELQSFDLEAHRKSCHSGDH